MKKLLLACMLTLISRSVHAKTYSTGNQNDFQKLYEEDKTAEQMQRELEHPELFGVPVEDSKAGADNIKGNTTYIQGKGTPVSPDASRPYGSIATAPAIPASAASAEQRLARNEQEYARREQEHKQKQLAFDRKVEEYRRKHTDIRDITSRERELLGKEQILNVKEIELNRKESEFSNEQRSR